MLIGLSLAWMKFIATYMPSSDPIGLNDCARFRRRVADPCGPIVRIYGLQDVSRNDSPQVSMKYAIRNMAYSPVIFAGKKRKAPRA